MTGSPAPTFSGFEPAATRFFKALALNQSREWFAEHKAEHEQFVKIPMGELVLAVTERLSATALPLVGDPKRSGGLLVGVVSGLWLTVMRILLPS